MSCWLFNRQGDVNYSSQLCGTCPQTVNRVRYPPADQAPDKKEYSMTLTKAHLAKALFAKNIFTKTQSAQVIDTLFELIKQSLQNGEEVLISGFGKF
jgi:hypothetical protein